MSKLDEWKDMARAAIEAMRQMTPAQDRAGALASCDRRWCRGHGMCGNAPPNMLLEDCLARARRAHEAIINAALEEGT